MISFDEDKFWDEVNELSYNTEHQVYQDGGTIEETVINLEILKEIIDGISMKNSHAEKQQYECGCCQREDAPCDNCIREPSNTDKEDPDLEDHYFHD